MKVTEACFVVGVPVDYPGWYDVLLAQLPQMAEDYCAAARVEALETPRFAGRSEHHGPGGDDLMLLLFTFRAVGE